MHDLTIDYDRYVTLHMHSIYTTIVLVACWKAHMHPLHDSQGTHISHDVYLTCPTFPDYGNSVQIPLWEPGKSRDCKYMLKPITLLRNCMIHRVLIHPTMCFWCFPLSQTMEIYREDRKPIIGILEWVIPNFPYWEIYTFFLWCERKVRRNWVETGFAKPV